MALALPLLLALLAGCIDAGDDADKPDGHFVNYRWGTSQQSCTNSVCKYGDNADAFEIELACRTQPELSWDAKAWVHGSITAKVLDDDGVEQAAHTVATNGGGSEVVAGKAGTWTLKGLTNDANGNAEIRLACV